MSKSPSKLELDKKIIEIDMHGSKDKTGKIV